MLRIAVLVMNRSQYDFCILYINGGYSDAREKT